MLPGGVVPEQGPLPKRKADEESAAPNRARMIVEVPSDAKLFIDDKPMKTTNEKRSFSTPDLEKGETYYYEVRVEVMRDGKPLSETRKVIMKPGEVAKVNFKNIETTATARVR
jgi:uncharacterized protein (TIGR03000 family)